jgi:hypothetical protein
MSQPTVSELLQGLQTVVSHLQTEEQDIYLSWFFKRMQTNVRSIRLLLAEECYADAHVIERVLLEHCTRVVHFKFNPPSTPQEIQLFKSKHEPSASKIMHEHLGDSTIYMMLSAFTHADSFSLAFEDDLQDTANSTTAYSASEFISSTSMTVCLQLLERAYPSVTTVYQAPDFNVLSALVSLGDNLVTAASFADTPLDEETRQLIPDLMGWKVRDQVVTLLSQIEKPSDIQELIANYFASVNKSE